MSRQSRVGGSALLLSLWAALSLAATSTSSSSSFDLVTVAEAQRWNAPNAKPAPGLQSRALPQPGVPSCHAIPDNASQAPSDPQIKIVAPTLDKPLTAPLDIDVQFVSASATVIRPDTFRVCYLGFITMDITQRITDHVTVSAQGVRVSGAQLPRGHHHLMMLIADAQGHFGRREANFDIQ
jgi:hypothetical protein